MAELRDVKDVRLQRLRRLVSEHEGMNNLARKLGLTKGAYISQLLSESPERTMSEKTARKWEKQLGLPQGWFDGATDVASTPPVNADLLGHVIESVTKTADELGVSLTPAQLSDLVAMHYADAVTAGGRIDTGRLRKVLGLLRR